MPSRTAKTPLQTWSPRALLLLVCFPTFCLDGQHAWLSKPCQQLWLFSLGQRSLLFKLWQLFLAVQALSARLAGQSLVSMLCCSSPVSLLGRSRPCHNLGCSKRLWWFAAGKYVLETGHMSGNNTFVFSAKRRGNNTPVVCKFFADEDGFRREMKFYERVHTGDFVPGQPFTQFWFTLTQACSMSAAANLNVKHIAQPFMHNMSTASILHVYCSAESLLVVSPEGRQQILQERHHFPCLTCCIAAAAVMRASPAKGDACGSAAAPCCMVQVMALEVVVLTGLLLQWCWSPLPRAMLLAVHPCLPALCWSAGITPSLTGTTSCSVNQMTLSCKVLFTWSATTSVSAYGCMLYEHHMHSA